MLRVIREVRPEYIVGENVAGLISWSGGMVFDQVQADLEDEGYEVIPVILPACGVNAPHRRDRIWFIAHFNGTRLQTQGAKIETARVKQYRELDRIAKNTIRDGRGGSEREEESSEREQRYIGAGDNERVPSYNDENWDAPDTECTRLEYWNETRNISGKEGASCRKGSESSNDLTTNGNVEWDAPDGKSQQGKRLRPASFGDARSQPGEFGGGYCWDLSRPSPDNHGERFQECDPSAITGGKERFDCEADSAIGEPGGWENFPTVPPVLSGDDGLSGLVDPDSISFSKWRNESIKAAGNAVVPQVVFEIFKAIERTRQ